MTFHELYRELPIDPRDRDRIWTIDTWAFPNTAPQQELSAHPIDLEDGRTWGVLATDSPDDAELVAMHGSFEQAAFSVPGSTVRSSGLTWVGVHPGHRRRGILSAMINAHFERSVARGEILSTLFAAEMSIYGRFGYGMAANELSLTLSRGASLRPVAGSDDHTVRIETASEDRHGELVQKLLKRTTASPFGAGVNRPGSYDFSAQSHRARWWHDSPALRAGFEHWRIAIVERAGIPEGFALFRRNSDWNQKGPHSKVTVQSPIAVSTAAAHALWSVLLDLDLTEQVNVSRLPLDDALVCLLTNRRAANPHIGDNVWVRLLDVPRALAARHYQSPIDAVIEITDERIATNSGRWRIQADAFGPAAVTPTTTTADLHLGVSALSAAYLGGVSLLSLANAGQVSAASQDALVTVSAAFGWPTAPLSPLQF